MLYIYHIKGKDLLMKTKQYNEKYNNAFQLHVICISEHYIYI